MEGRSKGNEAGFRDGEKTSDLKGRDATGNYKTQVVNWMVAAL